MDLSFDSSALDQSHSCGYREAYEALQALFKEEIVALKAKLQAQQEQIQSQGSKIEAQDSMIQSQGSKIEAQDSKIEVLNKDKFGRRSESRPHKKAKPELSAEEKAAKRARADEKRKANGKQRESLPARHFTVEVPADQRECLACGQTMKTWDTWTESTVFAFVPGHFERRIYNREAISCACQKFMAKAPAPRRPFQGGQKFDAGIVADLIVRKCADSMPLHRLRKAYRRQNIAISESTLARIFLEAGLHLKIIWERICELIAEQELVLADETPVKLTRHPARVKGKCKLGYMWVFLAPEILLFAYVFNVSRSSQTPVQILGGSKGTLVVDGYAGYNSVTTPGTRTRAGCNLHARRKFLSLGKAFNKEANEVRAFYRRIYEVEHQAKEQNILGTAEHLELRKTISTPVMNEFKNWLNKTKKEYLPKSSIRGAIDYTLNQWEALTHFLTDAKVPPGRVEKWRGRFRSKFVFTVCPPFRLWVPQYLNHAPFPLPSHRTGRADFPHPALTRNFMPSRSTGSDSSQTVCRGQVSRRDTCLDIGDTQCLSACA